MGEKGNVAEVATGVVAAGAGTLIERVTTTATETVTGVGQDFLETIKDKSIGAVADNTITAARERVQRRALNEDEDPPPAGEPPTPA